MIFVVIAGMFAFALTGADPHKLPSALIGKPVPATDFPAVEGLVNEGKPVPGFASADLAKGKVTIVIRPEHAQAVKAGADAVLGGTIRDIVYIGTDTHFHVHLDNGTLFIVRQQNAKSGPCGFEKGETIGIRISDDVAQILRD